MRSDNRIIISGTAMSVLLGVGSILVSIFGFSIDWLGRLTLFLLGLILIFLGVYFSRG